MHDFGGDDTIRINATTQRQDMPPAGVCLSNAFSERLRGHGPLSDHDVALLTGACQDVRTVRPNHHLIREGDKPDAVFVMLEGWAWLSVRIVVSANFAAAHATPNGTTMLSASWPIRARPR